MKSIRFYLVAALLSTVVLGNFVAAVYGYRSSMQQAQDLLDAQLDDTATLLQTIGGTGSRIVARPPARLAFQVWSTDGRLIQRSDNTGTEPITDFKTGYRDENFEGYRWRVVSREDEGQGRWYFVAERIDIRTELADNVIRHAVLPMVVSLPLIAAIVWLVVGNGLALIQQLAQELRNKRADDLTRLQTTDPPAELAPVVEAINDLLRRLNDSVVRERHFSADAAHELRTPISAITVHLHNLEKELPEHKALLGVLKRDLRRLGHLIEQIMLLYRTTPEHYQANMQAVDLHVLAQTVVGEVYAEIEKKRQTISLEGTPQTITGDQASLIILLRNLILNASKYSPEQASIEVQVGRTDFGVWLAVQDTGPGIPLAEISRIFDRFYRVGGDRHDSDVDGCGLGLAIVKHIADLHRANLHVENNADGPGLLVGVTFPFDTDAPLFVKGGRG